MSFLIISICYFPPMLLTLQDFKFLFYPSTINYQLPDKTRWFLAIIWCFEDCVYPPLIMLSLWCGYFPYFLYILALFRRAVPIGICPAASPSSAADYREVPAIMGCTDGSKYIPLTQKQHRIWYTGFARAVSAAYPEPTRVIEFHFIWFTAHIHWGFSCCLLL